MAILFNGAERFDRGSLYNHLKIRPLVKEEKLFKGFSMFSFGGYFVQWSGTVWAILVESNLRNIPV